MAFENIKAIFLDMDGTLLHEDNKATVKTKEVIDQLREKNYKVFLATGRSYSEIHSLVPKGFKVDGMISSNGTRGDIEDKLLFKHSLTIDSVKNRATSSTTTHLL